MENGRSKLMTITEMTKVMKAFAEGKKIQFTSVANKDVVWMDTDNPTWDFSSYNYRIKPKYKAKPYKGLDEMFADYKSRFNVPDWPIYTMPLIWLIRKDTGSKFLVTEFGRYSRDLNDVFEGYTYLDGSPCGILEADK